MHLPYRHHLNGATDAQTVKLLLQLFDAAVHATPVPNLLEIIDTADELVLWHLACQLHEYNSANTGVFSQERSVAFRAAHRLLVRAIRDADSEGIVWTPLLDVLADTIAWAVLVEEGPKIGTQVPSAQERAERLVPWVSETRDIAALRGLLDFRAEIVHMVLARHVRVLERDFLTSLLRTPGVAEQLAQNPVLDDKTKQALIEHAYTAWKTAVAQANTSRTSTPHPAGELEASTLVALLKHGFVLPPVVRADAFSIAQARILANMPEHAVRFLVCDHSTSSDMLEQLGTNVFPSDAAHILAHPNCPDAFWRELVMKPGNIEAVLAQYQLPTGEVQVIYEHLREKTDRSDLLLNILKQENSTPAMWLAEIANADWSTVVNVLSALSSNPRARQYPEVRAKLLDRNSVGIALNLLRDRRPDEFEHLMLPLLKRAPERAAAILRDDGIPPETPFPRRLIDALLTSRDREKRLLGISLLAQFRPIEELPELTGTEHEHSRLVNTRGQQM